MGVSGQRQVPAALSPVKGPAVPILQEAGWAPEPVWTQRLEENSLASNLDRPMIQSLARHYTDWAITALFVRLLHKILEFVMLNDEHF
jgi:hypothetical protein